MSEISNYSDQIGRAYGARGSLCSILPDKERASILLLLNEIAHSNDVRNKYESALLGVVLDALSISSTHDKNEHGLQVLKQKYDTMEIDEAISNLKSLTGAQKYEAMLWFVLMVNLDEDNQRSLQIINLIADSFGIDANQFSKKNEELILELINDFNNKIS